MNIKDSLIELLKIESYTGKEHAINDYLKKRAAEWNAFQTLHHGLTTVFFSPVDDSKPTLALYGHLDTVVNQQDEPPLERDGYIYGCGASDMKGGLAVMMGLMDAYPTQTSRFNLQFVFYDAEEGPYEQNGLFAALPKLDVLKKADLALVLEPTNNQIQAGCLGVVNLRIRFKGKSAHSARPWEGSNAIHASWPLIENLAEKTPVHRKIEGLDFYEVTNLTLANGGQQRNALPGEFELSVNHRFTPEKTGETAMREITQRITQFGADILEKEISPAGKVCRNHPILEELTRRFSLETTAKQAWTDIAQLTAAGLAAVNFGPGDPSQAHQVNERISVKSLLKNHEILNQFIYGSHD